MWTNKVLCFWQLVVKGAGYAALHTGHAAFHWICIRRPKLGRFKAIIRRLEKWHEYGPKGISRPIYPRRKRCHRRSILPCPCENFALVGIIDPPPDSMWLSLIIRVTIVFARVTISKTESATPTSVGHCPIGNKFYSEIPHGPTLTSEPPAIDDLRVQIICEDEQGQGQSFRDKEHRSPLHEQTTKYRAGHPKD